MNEPRHLRILTMPAAVTCYDDAAGRILGWAAGRQSRYVCVSNVHMCMETFDSPMFQRVLDGADLVVPDGRPLVWVLKALGAAKARQVRGSDLLLRLCQEAEASGVAIGLYGGTPESLRDFEAFLRRGFPQLVVACCISPPFRPLTADEDAANVALINQSGARILFIGVGCPKQENWMAAHRGRVNCVMIGVGAAFDFFSGRQKHAPRWMQRAGLEWAFRLASDPRRLWKRYLKHNPRFVWHFGKQLLKVRSET